MNNFLIILVSGLQSEYKFPDQKITIFTNLWYKSWSALKTALMLLSAAALTGISAVPVWTTGFAHIESQVRKRSGPLLFGLINMFAGVGAFFGIVGTALLLQIYVDFNRPGVEQFRVVETAHFCVTLTIF